MLIQQIGNTLIDRLVPQGLANAATSFIESLKINSISEKVRRGRRVVVKRRNIHGEQLADLTGRLRKRSRKITGPRRAILEILRQHPHPLTNREIFAAMREGNCDLATIYRSMHLLQEMGMVKRFDLWPCV